MSFHIGATRSGVACLVAIVAAGGAHAQAPAQPSLTLQDAFARALVDAPAMRAADQARLGAEAGVRQADRAPNPTLDITAENLLGSGPYSGIDRSETTFALSQRLEWGEDRQARASLAAADITIARASGDIRRQDLLYEVELAYLAVQKADADLAVALERAELAREIVTTVQRRVEAARDPLMAGAKAQTVLADAEIGRCPVAVGIHLVIQTDDGFLARNADHEFHREHRHARTRNRIHVFDAFDFRQHLLERKRDHVFDIARTRTGKRHEHIRHRDVDLRFFFAWRNHHRHHAEQ